jgi:hypothetical protein
MSDAMKHTPGPWKAVISDSDMSRVADSRGKDIARVSERTWESEGCANCHLIAAAPTLLDAVDAALKYLNTFVEEAYPTDGYSVACQVLTAAFNKATNGTD